MKPRLTIFSLRDIALLFVLFTVVWAYPSLCYSQAAFTAQVRGTVQDPTGAMIPGATVIIIADATQVSETVTTDQQGRYLFLSLPPTAYTIKVEASGFKTAVRAGVVL